jgi:hypothetical protein
MGAETSRIYADTASGRLRAPFNERSTSKNFWFVLLMLPFLVHRGTAVSMLIRAFSAFIRVESVDLPTWKF